MCPPLLIRWDLVVNCFLVDLLAFLFLMYNNFRQCLDSVRNLVFGILIHTKIHLYKGEMETYHVDQAFVHARGSIAGYLRDFNFQHYGIFSTP